MTKESTHLQKLKTITLSQSEKTRMRNTLIAYATAHPPVVVPSTPTFFSILMSSQKFSLYASFMALLVLVGGAGTYAAEGSAPGDPLYGIKIQVNEKVLSALAPTTEGQARLSGTLATRRIDEVLKLASSGRLTPEHEAYLAHAFSTEVEKTKATTKTLSAQGKTDTAEEVTADFEAHLASRAQALALAEAGHPEKTRAFLQSVLDVSRTDTESEHEDGALKTSEGGDTSVESVASAKTALSMKKGTSRTLAVSSTSSSTPKSTTTRSLNTTRRTQGLFLPASTTLRSLFESNSQIQPKTDHAIQTESDTDKTTTLKNDTTQLVR